MKIEPRKLADIRPYENNPRHNDDAVSAVVDSIREFGFRQPIVVDDDGVIVCGHTRWKAAKKLGLEKVPVHVAADLSPEQVKAYRLADNQTADLADWNFDLLPIELADLQRAEYDLSLIGFSAEEITQLLHREPCEGLTDPDEIPEPPEQAITRTGDLWLLGEHRLLCGDSSSALDVDRLVGGTKIELVHTDPPYNVKVEPRSNRAIVAGNTRDIARCVASFARSDRVIQGSIASQEQGRAKPSGIQRHRTRTQCRAGPSTFFGSFAGPTRGGRSPRSNGFFTPTKYFWLGK